MVPDMERGDDFRFLVMIEVHELKAGVIVVEGRSVGICDKDWAGGRLFDDAEPAYMAIRECDDEIVLSARPIEIRERAAPLLMFCRTRVFPHPCREYGG